MHTASADVCDGISNLPPQMLRSHSLDDDDLGGVSGGYTFHVYTSDVSDDESCNDGDSAD